MAATRVYVYRDIVSCRNFNPDYQPREGIVFAIFFYTFTVLLLMAFIGLAMHHANDD